jgi:hypothetical protein
MEEAENSKLMGCVDSSIDQWTLCEGQGDGGQGAKVCCWKLA